MLYRIQFMGLPFRNLGLARTAWQSLSVLAIVAVILAFIGPAMDHHFAERQHDHSHVYLTNSAASYGHPGLHPFEQTHYHGPSPADHLGQDGILFQTSNDGSQDSGSVVVGAVLNDGPTQISAGDLLSLAIFDGEGPSLEAFVEPPKNPPRF
ncbi:MAG: hypothetical protein O2913_11285 [Chloroflexi bacterium]|nr:hypothetical protein [Chloroflexota bacterium]